MGQKVNPNILRLGKFKTWGYKYLEKKVTETAKYAEKNEATRNLVSTFFQSYGLTVHQCNAHYSENVTTIFVTYSVNLIAVTLLKAQENACVKALKDTSTLGTKPAVLAGKVHALNLRRVNAMRSTYQLDRFLSGAFESPGEGRWFTTRFQKKISQQKQKHIIKVKPKTKKRHSYKNRYFTKSKGKESFKKKGGLWAGQLWVPFRYLTPESPYARKKRLEKRYANKAFRKLLAQKTVFRKYRALKTASCVLTASPCNVAVQGLFFEKLLKIIQAVGSPGAVIKLNVRQINFASTHQPAESQADPLKKSLNQLWRFKKVHYTKEGLRTIFFFLNNISFTPHFANYLAKEMRNHARQHVFLNFIQQALRLLNKRPICTPKKIIIRVQGRFNGASRSKFREIVIGTPIPIQSAQTPVHYAEATSFSKDGTFGVKVWAAYA